jgi:hypothetical protein
MGVIRYDYYVGINGNLKCNQSMKEGTGKGKAMVYFLVRKVLEGVLCINAVQKYFSCSIAADLFLGCALF